MSAAHVFDAWIDELPRWGETKWIYPSSHLLRGALRDVLVDVVPDEEYESAHDRYEYCVGLAQFRSQDVPAFRSMAGEYIGEQRWIYDSGPRAEVEFRARR